MALRPVQVNIKAVDPAALGRFWAQALGWQATTRATTYVGPPGDFVWPDPVAVGIDIVAVARPRTAARNRTQPASSRTAAGLAHNHPEASCHRDSLVEMASEARRRVRSTPADLWDE